jgi:flagellar hook assembly protein FlgD
VAGTTEIVFEVARDRRVSVKIYDIAGRCVRTLEDRRYRPGTHSTRWDRINDSGLPVASGVYFYRMEAGAFRATRKMLVLR